MRVPRRRTTAVVAGALIGLALPWPAAAAASAEEQLLDTYAPVLAVRTHTTACEGGEPYLPMTVDALFTVPGLTMRGPNGETIDQPTVDDLAAVAPGADWHIDVPGNALKPDCSYETIDTALDAPPTIYGRVATDPDHPGQLVAQYWFFYLYNDWNDRHEGDWEMMQLRFDAADATTAMAAGPVEAMVAQHEGGELSPWAGGPLVQLDGTHPVVFVAQGSHASYYSSARWFGKSAQSGFGCDDTRTPLTEVRPEVQLLSGDEPWLAYTGRWGEKQPSFNNGPTGPSTKTQWASPVSWMRDEGRVGAVALPAGGSTATDFFCNASRIGSVLFMRFLDSPVKVLLALATVIVMLVLLLRATTWRPVSIDPVVQHRAIGQTARAGARLVRTHLRVFAALGGILVVAGLAGAAVQNLLASASEVGDVFDVTGQGSTSGGVLAALIGLLLFVPTAGIVHIGTAAAVRSLAEDGEARVTSSLLAVWHRPRGLLADMVTRVVVSALLLSVVFAPIGLWLLSRWAVVAPSALESDRPLHRSRELSHRNRVRSLGLATIVTSINLIVPGLIGTLFLLLTDWSFLVVNVIAGMVAAVTVPLGAAAIALLHDDLALRQPA